MTKASPLQLSRKPKHHRLNAESTRLLGNSPSTSQKMEARYAAVVISSKPTRISVLNTFTGVALQADVIVVVLEREKLGSHPLR